MKRLPRGASFLLGFSPAAVVALALSWLDQWSGSLPGRYNTPLQTDGFVALVLVTVVAGVIIGRTVAHPDYRPFFFGRSSDSSSPRG